MTTCTAPGCPREARFLARGTSSYDECDFEENVCESCAGYLSECAIATGDPLSLEPLEMEAA